MTTEGVVEGVNAMQLPVPQQPTRLLMPLLHPQQSTPNQKPIVAAPEPTPAAVPPQKEPVLQPAAVSDGDPLASKQITPKVKGKG